MRMYLQARVVIRALGLVVFLLIIGGFSQGLQRQRENACHAQRPTTYETRDKGVGRACSRLEAERLAEIDLAREACTGEHDPECIGGCTGLPGGKCEKRARTHVKCVALKNPERCQGQYWSCVATGRISCLCLCSGAP